MLSHYVNILFIPSEKNNLLVLLHTLSNDFCHVPRLQSEQKVRATMTESERLCIGPVKVFFFRNDNSQEPGLSRESYKRLDRLVIVAGVDDIGWILGGGGRVEPSGREEEGGG